MTETYYSDDGKTVIRKDQNATLDYIFDWTAWLADITDTIASALVTVPAGITLSSTTNTTLKVTAWLSGGTVGAEYAIQCRITTASTPARIEDRTIYVRVVER